MRWVTAAEAAWQYPGGKLHRSTIYRWVKARLIRSRGRRGAVRVALDSDGFPVDAK